MSETPSTSEDATKPRNHHTAGAFDIRNVIGALIGIYGVILTAMGLLGDTEPDKTGDVNANLYAGLAMLLVGVVFVVWARLRPVVVPEERVEAERD